MIHFGAYSPLPGNISTNDAWHDIRIHCDADKHRHGLWLGSAIRAGIVRAHAGLAAAELASADTSLCSPGEQPRAVLPSIDHQVQVTP